MNQLNTSDWQGYGTIEADGDTLVWKPAPEVAWHAGEDFQLRFQERRSAGMRLILPVGGFVARSESKRIGPGAFFYDAQRGGLAILIAQGLDAESRQRHDTAFLYVRKLMSSRTWLRRRFTGPNDFKVSRLVQGEFGITTVVPASYDPKSVDDHSRDSKSLDDMLLDDTSLMRLGNQEAQRRGITKPSREQVVQVGLYFAAKLDPLPPESRTQDELRRITRAALLDPNMAPADVTDEELLMVAERFADAVESHLDDDIEDFHKWLLGPKNSFVTQLAKQRKAPGGVLAKERVTAALAELGWRSLSHWALCVETQMRCVAADLSEPLLREDLARFEMTYCRQPWLGGSISLCLLAERFGFLLEAVWDLIENPADTAARGTLLRLLQYYAAASTTRRDVDRQHHQLRKAKTQINETRDAQRRTRWRPSEE